MTAFYIRGDMKVTAHMLFGSVVYEHGTIVAFGDEYDAYSLYVDASSRDGAFYDGANDGDDVVDPRVLRATCRSVEFATNLLLQ